MNFENLIKLPLADLKVLAAKNDIRIRGNMKAETIAKQIAQKVSAPQVNPLKHVAEIPKAPAKINTEEEVREVCKAFLAKDGFEAIFKEETWHFRFMGAEDCGHMSVPLRIIRMKAENVSRGARKPLMVSIDGEKMLAAG